MSFQLIRETFISGMVCAKHRYPNLYHFSAFKNRHHNEHAMMFSKAYIVTICSNI